MSSVEQKPISASCDEQFLMQFEILVLKYAERTQIPAKYLGRRISAYYLEKLMETNIFCHSQIFYAYCKLIPSSKNDSEDDKNGELEKIVKVLIKGLNPFKLESIIQSVNYVEIYNGSYKFFYRLFCALEKELNYIPSLVKRCCQDVNVISGPKVEFCVNLLRETDKHHKGCFVIHGGKLFSEMSKYRCHVVSFIFVMAPAIWLFSKKLVKSHLHKGNDKLRTYLIDNKSDIMTLNHMKLLEQSARIEFPDLTPRTGEG